jgi:hypothetical protein
VLVEPVHLEGDHRPPGRRRQLRPLSGADDYAAVVEGEVDRQDRRQRPLRYHDPPERHRCEQIEALLAGEHFKAGRVQVHLASIGTRRVTGPEAKVLYRSRFVASSAFS